jgi:hypothetical protein
MRNFISYVLFLLLFPLSLAAALEEHGSVVFPPVNCTPELKFLGWQLGAPSTSCNSGQEVMTAAIATCTAGQYVAHDQDKFLCKTIPTCTARQFLQFDGTNFTCADLPFPSCEGGQQLVLVNGSLSCADSSFDTSDDSTADGGDSGGADADGSSADDDTSACTPANSISGYGSCILNPGIWQTGLGCTSLGAGAFLGSQIPCTGTQELYWSNGCGTTWTTTQPCTVAPPPTTPPESCYSEWGGTC